MAKKEMGFQEIPEIFYSFESKKPFEKCINCNRDLLDGDTDYIVEKAVRKYKDFEAKDVIFDYAICIDCALEMRKEFSKESAEKMDEYFSSHVNAQTMPIKDEGEIDVEKCIQHCVVKKIDIKELQEYQLFAYCRGEKLFQGIPPYMVSAAAVEEILPLLSNSTSDLLNGFYEKHFSPDPSLLEPTPKLVFL
ncbi:MAG: hypothetical protein KI790_02320 [Cyclobacteriaceae bacterium]|nr:hypothetical protein [Cyclobacteriaceae bacterium HetDA_MAG_MS6]